MFEVRRVNGRLVVQCANCGHTQGVSAKQAIGEAHIVCEECGVGGYT